MIEENSELSQLIDSLLPKVRKKLRRPPKPTVAIIDSQTVKADCGSTDIGYDGNKKVKGNKIHLATDSNGIPLANVLEPANKHDQKVAYKLITILLTKYPKIKVIYADSAYKGKIQKWCKKRYNVEIVISKSIIDKGFQVVPRRWVIERTFAWLSTYRQLTRNHCKSTDSYQTWLQLRVLVLLLKKLA
jgi:transposase